MRSHYRAALAAAFFAFTACGGPEDETADAAGRALTICDRVTSEELQRTTGRTYEAGQVVADEPGLQRCTWATTDADAGPIMLTVHPTNAESALEQYLAFPGMEEVEGPGEQTWWSHAVQTYVVRDGDRVIVVGFSTHDSSHRQHGQTIAEFAMARM